MSKSMSKRQRIQKANSSAVEEAIESLIDGWAKQFDDDDFIAALEEMESRARTALDARKEEIGQ